MYFGILINFLVYNVDNKTFDPRIIVFHCIYISNSTPLVPGFKYCYLSNKFENYKFSNNVPEIFSAYYII